MKKVIIYTTDNCIPCKMLKNALTVYQADFSKIEIINDPLKLKDEGIMTVPTAVFVENEIVKDVIVGIKPNLKETILSWISV